MGPSLSAVLAVTAGQILHSQGIGALTQPVSGGLTYLPIFLVGCVIARHLTTVQQVGRRIERTSGHHLAWVALFAVAIIALTLSWTVGHGLYSSDTKWIGAFTLFGAALVVLLAVVWPLGRNLLKRPAIRWLGRISFSLYLVHEPIVVSIGILLPEGARWLTVLIAVPAALLLGWIFFRVVERPSHRLAQAASRWLANQPSRARASTR